MRPRSLTELLRDTHIGSIIVAQFTASALAALVRLIEPLLSWTITTILNWFATHALRDSVSPFTLVSFSWSMLAMLFLGIAINFAAAYLLAVWIYSQRDRIRLGA
jgi:hypothetical protein